MILDEILTWAKRIAPQGDRLFCRYTKETRKIGSVWTPDSASKALDVVLSQVLARGPLVKAKPWELSTGDYVIHVRTAGLKYDGTLGWLGKQGQTGVKDADYVFLFEKDILAVVDPEMVGRITGEGQYSEGRTGEWHQAP